MLINQLMALLLPGVITLKIYEKLEGEEIRVQKIIKKYLKAIFIINLSMYLIAIYMLKEPEFIFTNKFTVKYMIIATIIAIIYPVLEKYVRANINIEVKVEPKNEKED